MNKNGSRFLFKVCLWRGLEINYGSKKCLLQPTFAYFAQKCQSIEKNLIDSELSKVFSSK